MKSYNIGQQAKVSMTRVKKSCNMPPYINLVNKSKDEKGFVTLCAVNEQMKTAEIAKSTTEGLIIGTVQVPFDSLIF